MPRGGNRKGAKQRKPTALQKALAKTPQQEEEKVQQPEEEEHSPTGELLLQKQDHVWVDMLLRFADESATFDPYTNTTMRTLIASDDWTEINTKDLAGEQLRIRLDPHKLVGDLKAEVAKKRGSPITSQIAVVVNGNAADDSMSITELLASAVNSPIYCWQKVDVEEPKSVETFSDRSSSIASANVSSDLYGSFSLFPNFGMASVPPQLQEMLHGMQQQMAEMQEHDRATNLIIAHHEKEVGSLRKSLARCAETLHENPGSIFGKSAATLAEFVRSMLARVRLKRRNASIQLQRIVRGLLVRNTLCYQTAEATKMQAVWRGLPPRQKLASLLQAIRSMQRIHRGRMVRKDIFHQAVEATKIQATWRVVSHRQKLVEMLRAIRPLQCIIRGGLTRKNLALQQCSASLIANTFRHHASNIHPQYGALYALNQELLRENKELERKYEIVHLKVQAAAAERLDEQERAMAAARKARDIYIEVLGQQQQGDSKEVLNGQLRFNGDFNFLMGNYELVEGKEVNVNGRGVWQMAGQE
jgi:hypothetical protein